MACIWSQPSLISLKKDTIKCIEYMRYMYFIFWRWYTYIWCNTGMDTIFCRIPDINPATRHWYIPFRMFPGSNRAVQKISAWFMLYFLKIWTTLFAWFMLYFLKIWTALFVWFMLYFLKIWTALFAWFMLYFLKIWTTLFAWFMLLNSQALVCSFKGRWDVIKLNPKLFFYFPINCTDIKFMN